MTEETLADNGLNEQDKYVLELIETGHQVCDLTYFDGEKVITLLHVHIKKDSDHTIYYTLENKKFLDVTVYDYLHNNGYDMGYDIDKQEQTSKELILNTSSIIHLDVSCFGIHGTIDDIET
tara:strand:- start:356 stop:718 length:363 start_codon:yes stop_codon:yes gene_type:complete